MILITYFFYLYFYSYIVKAAVAQSPDTEGQQFYKISMVSSHEKPGRPALFTHAKSPVWDPELQSLYFVDVREKKVHRLDYLSGKITSKKIEYGPVNVVSLVAGSRRLLVAVRTSLYLLDWAIEGDAAIRLLTTVDMGLPDNVINEGKPDAEGRFWAGTKPTDDMSLDKGTLYMVEQECVDRPRLQVRPVSVPYGITWSLNSTTMYYIDSATKKIEAFDFDPQRGDLSGRRLILDIVNYGYEEAKPEGMTIDNNGNLWVALMFAGTVLNIDPENRQVLFDYKLPVAHTSSVCWGGPKLDELFVTTAKDAAENSPEALGGAIFTIRGTGSQGIPATVFRFDNADFY